MCVEEEDKVINTCWALQGMLHAFLSTNRFLCIIFCFENNGFHKSTHRLAMGWLPSFLPLKSLKGNRLEPV